MADLQEVLAAVDKMTPEELDQLAQHIAQRQETLKGDKPGWWHVPVENLQALKDILRPVHEQTANMPEEEVNAVIDEALAEVRRERKAKRRD